MGGMSLKCPFCIKWTTDKGVLKQHLKDRHGLTNIRVEGTASCLTIYNGQSKYAAVAIPVNVE